jgi:uncharacterized protein YbjQ (UPF0145 family)
MKIRIATACALSALLVVSVAHARDERLKMPIKDAMETVDAQDKLGTDIKFFFGSQASPKAKQTLGTFTANKKTNFANKSDEAGCQRAFLSAMITLKERAVREGGNAVVNIHSVYKDSKFQSDTEYECGAGKIMGGVALRGTIVKL